MKKYSDRHGWLHLWSFLSSSLRYYPYIFLAPTILKNKIPFLFQSLELGNVKNLNKGSRRKKRSIKKNRTGKAEIARRMMSECCWVFSKCVSHDRCYALIIKTAISNAAANLIKRAGWNDTSPPLLFKER